MENETIRRVNIWSGWLRLSHWLIACGVLFELASGWAKLHDVVDPLFWHDWHIMVGQLTALALLLRVVLLFFPGTSHWRALLPGRTDWQSMAAMLKFYISLARTPLPAWYAHNPLWKPLYLLVLAMLAGTVITGLFHDMPRLAAGYGSDDLHWMLAGGTLLFTVSHVVAVCLHDWKGTGALISAMFSGHRYFHVTRQGPAEDAIFRRQASVPVNLDGLDKKDRNTR